MHILRNLLAVAAIGRVAMILWGRLDLSERIQLALCTLVIVWAMVSLWWEARKAREVATLRATPHGEVQNLSATIKVKDGEIEVLKADVERLTRERAAWPLLGTTIASGGGGGGGSGGGAGGSAVINIHHQSEDKSKK